MNGTDLNELQLAVKSPPCPFGLRRDNLRYVSRAKVGEPRWDRTIDPLIKSQMLYR